MKIKLSKQEKKIIIRTFEYALEKSIPVLLGYLFIGIAFGLLLQKAGFSVIWAFLMSVFVYAGSMQYVLVTFLAAGTPLATVAIMTLLINGRHIFYGLSFIERFQKMGKRYPYMVFSLTDETYSLLCSVKEEEGIDEKRALFYIAILDHCYWITGSVIGSLIGQFITFNSKGVEFAMTALFTVIFVEQWRDAKSHIPAITGILSAVVFLILLGPDKFLIPSLFVTVFVLMVTRSKVEQVDMKEDVA